MEWLVVYPMRLNQNLRVIWKLVNPQDYVWENLYRFIMRTILQEEETIHNNITIWSTNLFLCLTPWKIPAAKAAVTRNGKNWRTFRRGTWRKSEVHKVIDEARMKGVKVQVQYGRSSRSSWAKSSWSSCGRTVMGKAIWEKSIAARLWEGFWIVNTHSLTVKKGYSFGRKRMTSNWPGGNRTLIRCEKYLTTKSIRENHNLSLIVKTWAALKDNVKEAKMYWTITEPCLNHDFSAGRNEKDPYSENVRISSSFVWQGRSCKENVWNDIVS